jgi:hypothetical protein
MYDDPGLIRKQVTSRDGEQRQDVDYFSVFFDTYNDPLEVGNMESPIISKAL